MKPASRSTYEQGQRDYEAAMAEATELGLMSGSEATDRCQCPSCGEVFTTEGNFDRHLMPGRLAEDYDGPWCRPPTEVGLVQTDGHQWWHQPAPEGPIARSAAPVGDA